MAPDHLEKQISAVLHTATRVNRLAEQIHGSSGRRTVSIVSRLLMRQDSSAVPPWSNEETLLFLYNCDANKETLSYLLETFDGNLGQILNTLTSWLRLLSKEVLTVDMVVHMEQLLFLSGQLISAHGTRHRAPENVNAYVDIAKSLLWISTALNLSASRTDKESRHHATIAIIFGLMLYANISGYNDLPLAIAIVRLGLFDVILAVHSHIAQITESKKDLVEIMNPVISRVVLYHIYSPCWMGVTSSRHQD